MHGKLRHQEFIDRGVAVLMKTFHCSNRNDKAKWESWLIKKGQGK